MVTYKIKYFIEHINSIKLNIFPFKVRNKILHLISPTTCTDPISFTVICVIYFYDNIYFYRKYFLELIYYGRVCVSKLDGSLSTNINLLK